MFLEVLEMFLVLLLQVPMRDDEEMLDSAHHLLKEQVVVTVLVVEMLVLEILHLIV